MTDRKKALLWGLEITGIETEDNLSNVHLRQKLADYLNLLIQQDFNALIALLYRIDVSEEKAKKALESKKETETEGEILADLCIERLQQKLITRKKYSSGEGGNS